MRFSVSPELVTSPTRRYLIAVVLSVSFVAFRSALEPTLQGQAPLMALLAAPIIAAWLGGFGPGLLATLLCAVAGQLLFVEPKLVFVALSRDEWLRLAIFVADGALFSGLVHMHRNAVIRLTRKNEELLAAERRVRETLDASPSAMIVANEHGIIELANGQAERLFGFTGEEIIGMPVDRLVPDHLRAVHSAHRRRYRENPSRRSMAITSVVLYAQRKDGSVFPAEIGLNPLQGASSGRVLASVLDVTQRHIAEQAVREADRRKDEFIAVLAHELRNPLAPVRMAVEIFRRLGPSDPRLQRARDIIGRQVSHMARLIDDLLDVSRITRGQIDLHVERCDLAAIARQVAEDYRPSLEASGLSLVVHEPPHPLWVDGDRVRLAQMVGNVLVNAGRFNHKHGSIEVGLAADGANRMAEVRVANTGPGIEAGTLKRIFEPFEQAPQDAARSKGGLGLGLPLTKGLAELHGGTVDVHSEGTGRGATVWLRLPLAIDGKPEVLAREADTARQ